MTPTDRVSLPTSSAARLQSYRSGVRGRTPIILFVAIAMMGGLGCGEWAGNDAGQRKGDIQRNSINRGEWSDLIR